MNKKAFSAIVIALILALCLGALSSCAKEKQVSRIQILGGSFKDNYSLDETVDYDKLYIIVTYKDGDTARVKVQPEWIEGFDLSTTGSRKALTVNYKGAKAEYLYSVTYKYSVTSPVRLSATKGDANGKKEITLALANLDRMPAYAVRVDISLNGMKYEGREDTLPEGWGATQNASGGKLSLLFFAADGTAPLEGGLTKVYLSGQSDTIYLEAVISDGVSDHRLPDISLGIK